MFGYTAPKPLTEKQQQEEGGGAVLGSGKEKIEGGLGEWSCGGRRERPAGFKVLLTQPVVIFFQMHRMVALFSGCVHANG